MFYNKDTNSKIKEGIGAIAPYTMSNFHSHTYYSIRDGIQSPEQIANFQLKNGKSWFCVTDHSSMAAHPQCFEVAKSLNMRFLAGCEFYVQPSPDHDGKLTISRLGEINKRLKAKTLDDATRQALTEERDRITSVKGYNEWYYHLTVIAFNKTGLKNLYKINNHGDFYYKTRARKEDLLKYNEGLVVLSGCPAGELLKMIEYGDYGLAESWIKEFKEVYGDRLYFELMFHDGVYNISEEQANGLGEEELREARIAREKEVYTKGIELARKYGLKIVGSNDSHYTTPEDRRYWLITRKAMIGNDKDFTGNYHLIDDNQYFEDAYPGLVTKEELDESENEIISRYEPYEMSRSPYHSTQKDKEYLERLVWTGFKEKRVGTEWEEKSLLQIPYELAVIQTKDFDRYFLSSRDIIKSAFERGVLPGPGRGSSGGSEVTYMLGITEVDPLKFGLMFERFLNPERNSMPDVDIDLCSSVCDNFEPDLWYKERFYTSHENLVSDEEIAQFWSQYRDLKVKTGDTRRESVLDYSHTPHFDHFIGLPVE